LFFVGGVFQVSNSSEKKRKEEPKKKNKKRYKYKTNALQ